MSGADWQLQRGTWPRWPHMTWRRQCTAQRCGSQVPWPSWNTLNDGAVAFIFKLCLTSVTTGWILTHLVCISKFTMKLWKLGYRRFWYISKPQTAEQDLPRVATCSCAVSVLPAFNLSPDTAHPTEPVCPWCSESWSSPPASNHVTPCRF